jgi:ankyrin repeat protein
MRMRLRRTASWALAAGLAAGAVAVADDATSLHELAANDRVGQIAQAIEGGIPVDERDREGRTALHVAAETPHLFAAMMLIAKGADPNARDRRRRTPLHLAADGDDRTAGERFQVVKLLVAKGSNLKALDADGKRPVDYATTKEFREELTP